MYLQAWDFGTERFTLGIYRVAAHYNHLLDDKKANFELLNVSIHIRQFQ